jgi:hypothetical protein
VALAEDAEAQGIDNKNATECPQNKQNGVFFEI